MEKIKSVIIFSIVAMVSVSCIAVILILNSNNADKISQYGIESTTPYYISADVSTESGLKKFNSTDELRVFLLDASARATQESNVVHGGIGSYTTGGLAMGGPVLGPIAPSAGTVPAPANSLQAAKGSANSVNQGPDYSATNIQ